MRPLSVPSTLPSSIRVLPIVWTRCSVDLSLIEVERAALAPSDLSAWRGRLARGLQGSCRGGLLRRCRGGGSPTRVQTLAHGHQAAPQTVWHGCEVSDP
jgi:hypothetical protein